MRIVVLSLMLAALAACDAGSAAQRDPSRETHTAALTGLFKASSDTAIQRTGDIEVQRAGLLFNTGMVLYTRTLEPRRGGDAVGVSGDSYASIAVRPAEVGVELRRVTEEIAPTGGASFCGAEAAQYVALVFDERATALTVLVFAGDEAPGPDATGSRLCATLAYVAPSGARTRQGVVL